MALTQIETPFPVFFDSDGTPLDAGYVYVGVENMDPVTNPITVYWDSALTIPAAQPVRTINGYFSRSGSPSRLYANSGASITVKDRNNLFVYNSNISEESLRGDLASSDITKGDELIAVVQPFAGAKEQTQHDKNAMTLAVGDADVVGDGVTDDTVALKAVIAGVPSYGTLYVTPGTFRATSKITLDRPITIKGSGGIILFDFPVGTSTTDGGLFNVASSDVTFDGVHIDATGVTGTITGVNRYAIKVEPAGATRYSNICINRCKFTNLTQYSGSIPATTTVMHAIYAKQVDDLRVTDNAFNTISGACVFLVDTERAKVRGNDLIKFGWSGIWLNNANLNCEIDENTFSGTTAANPSYWGGAIDVMGQTSDASAPGEVDQGVLIRDNKFIGGVYRYGQVVRISSGRGVVISGNLFDQPNADDNATAGGGAIGSHNHHIVCTVRDITLNNGPHKFVTITDNIFRASGAGWQIPIYVITTSGTNTNTTACEGIIIDDNQFESVDGSNYFMSAFVLHGFAAGYNDIFFRGNNVKCTPHAVANYEPASLPGAVVIIANPGKTVSRVHISDNTFERYSGVGTGNNDNAVYIYVDVTDVQIKGNEFRSFFRDITINSGNTGNVPILQNLHNRNAGGSDWNLHGLAFNYKAGTQKTAANSIDATGTVFHVTGATVIKTIVLPNTGGGSDQPVLTLIPDSAFTTDATGNISVASTAVVNRAMTMTYDGTKWNPSYV